MLNSNSAKRNFFIVVESPLTDRDYKRFGVEILAENYNVVIFDLTEYLFKGLNSQYKPLDKNVYPSLYEIENEQDLKDKFHQIKKNDYVLCLFGGGFEYRLVHELLYQAQAFKINSYLDINSNLVLSENQGNSLKHILRKIKMIFFSPRRLCAIIYNRLIWPKKKNYAANLLLISGEKSNTGNFIESNLTKKLLGHALDYNIFLSLKDIELSKDHILFLDEFEPFHPDYLRCKDLVPPPADEYYDLLCFCFDYLEQKFKLPVVIAAHPRSQYSSMPDYFKGRKIVYGKTGELVKMSLLVLTHCSTATRFAVLAKKPIICLTMDHYIRVGNKQVDYLAQSLHLKIINLNKKIDIDWSDLNYDEDIYANYIREILKIPGSPEENTWVILTKYLKELEMAKNR